MASLRNAVPWWAKIIAKLVLSRLPVGYPVWRRIGIFVHGVMNEPAQAIAVFRQHYDRWTARRQVPSDFTVLELGPGDGVLSGVVARAFGAGATYLVDTGAFAERDVASLRRAAQVLAEAGHPIALPAAGADFASALRFWNIHYLTDGVRSLRAIAGASVDFCWSNVVFEHIRKTDVLPTLVEPRRIIKPDGLCSHDIDFADHLGGGLNNLRFSDAFWENDRVATSGFYTNRLRLSDFERLFAAAGFTVELANVARWDALPLRPRHLAEIFASYDRWDLLVKGAQLVATPAVATRHDADQARAVR